MLQFFSPSLNLKEEYLKITVTIAISSFSNKKFIIIHNNEKKKEKLKQEKKKEKLKQAVTDM